MEDVEEARLWKGIKVDWDVEVLEEIGAGRVDGNKRISTLLLHPLLSVNASGHGIFETFALTIN